MFTRSSLVTGLGQFTEPVGAAFALPVAAVSQPIKTSDGVYVIRVDKRVLADSAGFYSVAGLPPAVYSVTATAPQFEPWTADNVTVPVDEHVRLDLTLAGAGQR